jgi:prepilin-type N-terminal cleavage/methylation domain-containing protein/prepilin-type processing-associated H-X9-DG protein
MEQRRQAGGHHPPPARLPSTPINKRSRPGFTLIELLVTISIIVILAALGFIAFKRARESASSAADLNQLRGLGTAISGVAGEDGRYPLSRVAGGDWTYWMDEVRESIRLHYRLDDDYNVADTEEFVAKRLDVNIPADTENSQLRGLKHFAATEAVMPWRANLNDYDGVPVTAIKRPVETALLVDAKRDDQPLKNSHINLWGPFRSRWFIPGATWAVADNPARANKMIEPADCEAHIDFRNNGKAHVLFVDGHVRRMGPEDFRYKMFSNAY